MIKLAIAVGNSRLNPTIQTKRVSWETTLVNKLLTCKRTAESYAEYMAFPVARQAAIKDVGFFVGGSFSGTTRKRKELVNRSLITLDIDHLPSWDLDLVAETYGGFEHVLHSTHKHGPNQPRLRLVLPLSRTITPDEYEPVARGIAAFMGMDYFDDTTYQPARIMYWPSAARDGEVIAEHHEGEWLNPDQILEKYADPTDFGEWPVSSRETKLQRLPKDESADPLTAPGVVGAFNRCFDIHEAIARFKLPYESTGIDNRYRPIGSTGASGAVVYDDVFLYSHHESDPARQKNLNAFDLVRIHKFGDWTEYDLALELPVTQRDSYKQMAALAATTDEVQTALISTEFPDEAEPTPGTEITAKPSKLNYKALRQQIEALTTETRTEANLNKLVIRVAAARLDPIETDTLAAVLKNNWTEPQPQKASILRQIETQAKRLTAKLSDAAGEIVDMERKLIQAVLDEWFSGGAWIKRWARQYWVFIHGVWQPMDEEWIQSKILLTLYRLREERPEDSAALLALVATVGESKTSTLSASLTMMFRATIAGRESTKDPLHMQELVKPSVINCLNGEIWFNADNSGRYSFQPHKAEHYLTHQINAEYNPKAVAPGWDEFTHTMFSDKQDVEGHIRHLEEICGYVMQLDRSKKVWVLFHGEGYNGKSAVGAVVTTLLGDSSIEKRLSDYGEGGSTHAEAGLPGKLMLIDDDYTQGAMLPDGFIKKLSEGKHITANPKFANEFRFVNRAVPVILTNHWPPTRDTSLAIRERVLVIDFTFYFSPEIRDEAAKNHILQHELSGVLNRFIAGAARLIARGRFDEPEECARAREHWLAMSNPVAMFVDECLAKVLPEEKPEGKRRSPGALKTKPIVMLTARDAWMRYRGWSRDNNPRGSMLKRSTFLEKLDSLIGKPVGTGISQPVYMGYKLNEDDEGEF